MHLNRSKGNMFSSVGYTWNCVRGCSHGCLECWAALFAKRRGEDFTKPILVNKAFEGPFPGDGKWIFICATGDLFCDAVPDEWIIRVLEKIRRNGEGNRFLLQTKNPARIMRFKSLLKPINRFIIGTTLETNRDTSAWSRAPHPLLRASSMKDFTEYTRFLSLEPLADFDASELLQLIDAVDPMVVEVGVENYSSFLPKPPREKILGLLDALVLMKIPVVIPKPSLKPYLEASA
jgi:protein gp37